MAEHPYPRRRDSKHRVLRRGESIRADGKYQFKYHVNGKPKFVYSWRLEPTDKLPQGKKPCLSLWELEKQIGYDLDSQMDTKKKEHDCDGAGREILSDKNRSGAQHLSQLQVCENHPVQGGLRWEEDRRDQNV